MRLEVTVSMTVLILLGLMVALATTYPAEVRLVPLVVGIPGTVLAAWQTAGVMRRAAGARPSDAEREPGPERRPEARAFAWLAAFIAIVITGGLVAGGTIAVLLAQRFWLRERWPIALAGAGIAFVVTYVVFERMLGLVLFSGLLVEALR